MLLLAALPAGAQSPWLIAWGDGGCGSDFVPTWHTAGEMPIIGNAGFVLVSENLIGQAPGLVLLSAASANLPFFGMTVYVDPALLVGQGCQVTGPRGVAGAGVASLRLPIPSSGALAGGRLFVQGFFFDATLPSGWVHTQGLGITIGRSHPAHRAVIRDRLRYQALFAGLNQTAADTLGRAIWTANQMAGYSYLRTEQFACGGVSHWMVIVLHAQTGLEFCLIPGGSFRMGDINETASRRSELPVRRVHIQPFLLARTELPQSVWQAVMGSNPSRWPGPTRPVEEVTWSDAQAFGGRTGLRLPSEAEWEYACRAGVDQCYHFGVNYVAPGPANLGLHAWYHGNSGQMTHPVAGKLPNAFGLYDMYGNVWELVEDWLVPNPFDYRCAPSDGRAWLLGPRGGGGYRGGSWMNGRQFCRSSFRGGGMIQARGHTGFRPASPPLP